MMTKAEILEWLKDELSLHDGKDDVTIKGLQKLSKKELWNLFQAVRSAIYNG